MRAGVAWVPNYVNHSDRLWEKPNLERGIRTKDDPPGNKGIVDPVLMVSEGKEILVKGGS